MNKEQINAFNRNCAEFLGYKNMTPDDKDFNFYQNKDGDTLELMSMAFHTDWNRIIEVKEKICNLDMIDSFICTYERDIKDTRRYMVEIFSSDQDLEITTSYCESEKEATIEAINEFLIYYNNR